MTSKQKKNLMVIAGVIISVGLLWALFRNIDFSRLWIVLKGADYIWLLPNMFLIVFAMYQRAWRWQSMLAPIKKVAYSNLIAATCIGFMANNVLPLRLGELVRAYSLSMQDPEISKSASLANIFVERVVFDLMALLVIFCVILGLGELPMNEQFQFGLTVAISVALLGLVAMLVLALKPEQSVRRMIKYLFFLPERLKERVADIAIKFSQGLQFLRKGRVVLSVTLQTVAIWIGMGLSNYFVFQAFGFDLSVSVSYVLLVVVSIAILVPSSPGFIGVYHAGAVWTLTEYGISMEDALSFALVLHAAFYLPTTLLGFYYLKKEHLSLRRLEDEAVD